MAEFKGTFFSLIREDLKKYLNNIALFIKQQGYTKEELRDVKVNRVR